MTGRQTDRQTNRQTDRQKGTHHLRKGDREQGRESRVSIREREDMGERGRREPRSENPENRDMLSSGGREREPKKERDAGEKE